MYIDTHCHLNFNVFDEDRPMVIGNAKKAGVKKFIVPGVDAVSSNRALELAKTYPGVIYASVGFHPYEAQKTRSEGHLETLITSFFTHIPAKSSDSLPCTAIGECGLDYHLYKGFPAVSKKDNQKILFESHLKLAAKYNLPVIMHCREAFQDLFDVLDSQPELPRGVVHCFSGGLEDVRLAQQRNIFIGIDGNVTYSKLLEQIIPHIPLSMILLETDSPNLTPIPHRGKRNEPKYVPLVARKISELKNISVGDVEENSLKNTLSLFNLS